VKTVYDKKNQSPLGKRQNPSRVVSKKNKKQIKIFYELCNTLYGIGNITGIYGIGNRADTDCLLSETDFMEKGARAKAEEIDLLLHFFPL